MDKINLEKQEKYNNMINKLNLLKKQKYKLEFEIKKLKEYIDEFETNNLSIEFKKNYYTITNLKLDILYEDDF